MEKKCKYCGGDLPPRARIQCVTCGTLKAEAHFQGYYDDVVNFMEVNSATLQGDALHDEVAKQFPCVEPRLWALRKANQNATQHKETDHN